MSELENIEPLELDPSNFKQKEIITKIALTAKEGVSINQIRDICDQCGITPVNGYYSPSEDTPLKLREDDTKCESAITLYTSLDREGIDFEYHEEDKTLVIGKE